MLTTIMRARLAGRILHHPSYAFFLRRIAFMCRDFY